MMHPFTRGLIIGSAVSAVLWAIIFLVIWLLL